MCWICSKYPVYLEIKQKVKSVISSAPNEIAKESLSFMSNLNTFSLILMDVYASLSTVFAAYVNIDNTEYLVLCKLVVHSLQADWFCFSMCLRNAAQGQIKFSELN